MGKNLEFNSEKKEELLKYLKNELKNAQEYNDIPKIEALKERIIELGGDLENDDNEPLKAA
jgi:hypothetical protein